MTHREIQKATWLWLATISDIRNNREGIHEQLDMELAQIAKEIENESVSVDVLAQKVKRASELITLCQTRLKSTETEVNKIIANMESSK